MSPSIVERSLRVAVLGTVNSGKSSLVNSLTGYASCPVSCKSHTTRTHIRALFTKKDAQIVFGDTAGLSSKKESARFHLEESLIRSPAVGAKDADLLLVVHDVSNRYTREALHRQVVELLCNFSHIPAVLVLNKMGECCFQ